MNNPACVEYNLRVQARLCAHKIYPKNPSNTKNIAELPNKNSNNLKCFKT